MGCECSHHYTTTALQEFFEKSMTSILLWIWSVILKIAHSVEIIIGSWYFSQVNHKNDFKPCKCNKEENKQMSDSQISWNTVPTKAKRFQLSNNNCPIYFLEFSKTQDQRSQDCKIFFRLWLKPIKKCYCSLAVFEALAKSFLSGSTSSKKMTPTVNYKSQFFTTAGKRPLSMAPEMDGIWMNQLCSQWMVSCH